jgi:hypothetical protein
MSTPDAGADTPDVSIEVRMLTTDCAVREEQPSHAFRKQFTAGAVGFHASKKFAGKLVRLEQPPQVWLKDVPALVSISGKLVRPEQLYQVA